MNIEINDEIFGALKAEMPWIAFETTDSQIIESMLIEKLRQNVCTGFELDPITSAHSFYSFLKDAETMFLSKIEFTVYNIVGMKSFNDINGFPAGNEIIKAVGNLLIETVLPEKLYRISGDRFLIASMPMPLVNNTMIKIESIQMKNLQPIIESEWLFHHKVGVLDFILNASIRNSNQYFEVIDRTIY